MWDVAFFVPRPSSLVLCSSIAADHPEPRTQNVPPWSQPGGRSQTVVKAGQKMNSQEHVGLVKRIRTFIPQPQP